MTTEKKESPERQDIQRPPLRAKDVIPEQLRRLWQRQLLGHLISGNVHYADRNH